VIIVIGKTPEERAKALEQAEALAAELRKHQLVVTVDNDETKGPGFKYYEYELLGVCLRIELGPKDVAKQQCVMVRRDNGQKEPVPLARVPARAKEILEDMQQSLFRKAKSFLEQNTFEVHSYQELKDKADSGFLLAHWCESPACEAKIKEETGVTARCRPFTLKQEKGSCAVCGNPSPGWMVFAKAY
jgi:prolyl-tRNA synthetase